MKTILASTALALALAVISQKAFANKTERLKCINESYKELTLK